MKIKNNAATLVFLTLVVLMLACGPASTLTPAAPTATEAPTEETTLGDPHADRSMCGSTNPQMPENYRLIGTSAVYLAFDKSGNLLGTMRLSVNANLDLVYSVDEYPEDKIVLGPGTHQVATRFGKTLEVFLDCDGKLFEPDYADDAHTNTTP